MRQPITLKIKFKSASLDQFIERYSVDVSRGGIFIRTKEPLQVGTQLKFEFQLQDSSSLISGEGTVVWIREHDPNRTGVAPGMGVKFDKVASSSGQVLDQILAEKARRGEGQVESRFDAGVRASASASGTAIPARRPNDFDALDSKVMTPLPNPMPGFDAAEGEFGQESTRVMQDDVVQRLAERTRGAVVGQSLGPARVARDEQFSDEPTRARSAEELDILAKSSGPIHIGDEMEERTNIDTKPARPKAPVISSSPPPGAARPGSASPPPPAALAASEKTASGASQAAPPPQALAAPYPPSPSAAIDVSAPLARAMADASEDDPTGAIPLTPEEPTLRQERPPVRKKSSPLPAILGVGVLAAAAVGYFVLSPGTGTTSTSKNTSDPIAVVAPTAKEPDVTPPSANDPRVDPATKTAANPVAKKAADAVDPAVPKGQTVAVSSEPPGATLFVDGKEQGTTPATLAELEPKKSHELRFVLKGYRDQKSTVVAKEGAKVDVKLVANEKVVEVSSTPPGADVFVDGKKLGRTPYAIRKFDLTKEHQVELRHGGFVNQARAVSASDAWETKAEGRDVLAIALTLEAEPKVAKAPVRRVISKKPDGDAGTKPVVGEKPPETVEKPTAVEKPPATEPEKPAAEKPAEKPVEKPAAKPADDEKSIKTPAWMKKSDKPEEGGEAQ